ncbi:MAG: hypothetical protein QXL57_00975 [Candidatus Bathyarchaeia archaeon]
MQLNSMKRKFSGGKVNLALLTDSIVNFFVAKDFEVIRGESKKGFQIFAYDSSQVKLGSPVSVTIEGEKDDFEVNFELSDKPNKRSWFPSYFLTIMLGGGYFLVKKFRSDEAFLKLEKEFWTYIYGIIADLEYLKEE